MACNTSSCGSNCYKHEEDEEETKTSTNGIKTTRRTSNGCRKENICLKCKTNKPISNDTSADYEKICADCFKSNLYGKFRVAVSSHAMITPSDNVLVAFSGGPSSRVALQFVHELQQKAQRNYEASKDRSLAVFGVGVAFIDESSAYPALSHQNIEVIKQITLIVSSLAAEMRGLHVFPIEKLFGSDDVDAKDKLSKLLEAVSDATGKEDLLLYLRMLALQKVAIENGYNRIVLGLCTSRIASNVILATVKGQGYSLPADIQYVDARREIPVLLPLRDCLARELKLFCHLDGLKVVDLHSSPSTGINGLVSSFLTILQEENPARECTIVRTAGKLTPFHFNRLPELKDSKVPLATRRRQMRNNRNHTESISSESFCLICNSPLMKSEMKNLSNPESFQTSDEFTSNCCSSCQFQIIPKDQSSMENFRSLLPDPSLMRTDHGNRPNLSLLRERIQDCLLSDGEDEI